MHTNRSRSDPTPRRRLAAYDVFKRVFDLGLGLVLLVASAPIMIVIAIAVAIDSRGPVFFRQERAGRDGVPFRMIKFRSMVHGSDESIHRGYYKTLVEGSAQLRAGQGADALFLLDDPRVTRFGRVLRHSSLDELPNLLNVIAGSMSLVGPRPPIPYEVEMYDDRAMQRLKVKPGMTGLAQVSGRGSLDFAAIVRADLEYIRVRSLWTDVKILLRTIPAVLRRRGV